MLETLMIVALLLQLGDYLTTVKAIHMGGIEANPVVRKLMDKFGLKAGLGIAKLIGVVAVVVLYNAEPRVAEIGLWALVLLYTVIVISNGYAIKKMK